MQSAITRGFYNNGQSAVKRPKAENVEEGKTMGDAGSGFETLKQTLQFICLAVGALLLVAALLLYAINNVTDSSGGKGQGAMITCVIGALAAFAAAGIAMLVPDPADFTSGA